MVFDQKVCELIHLQGLRDDFVDARAVRLLKEPLLGKAGNRNDLRLLFGWHADRAVHLPDAPYGLVTVQDGHFAFYNYQGETIGSPLEKGSLNLVPSRLAILYVHRILMSILEAQDHEEAIYDLMVRLLVIDHQNVPLRPHLSLVEVRELELDRLLGLLVVGLALLAVALNDHF